MSWQLMRFRDFLKRSKIPVDIQDEELYKRVTIKIKHNGVSLRDEKIGKQIGTKKQFILKAGQFILSKIDARYGAFGIAPEEIDGAIITGNFWAYDVDFSLVNIDWFNQFTNSQDFYDLCERASSGITHRKYLNEDSFLDNEIYLPSPEEQLQIIEEFKTNRESINILSTELTQQLDLVKQLRQAFLREAMQGKLVSQDPNDEPASVLLEKIKAEKERLIKEGKIKKQKPLPPIAEDEIPFEIPDNWVWCRLGEIVYDQSYGTSSKADLSSEIPVLRMGNITTDGKILYSNLKYISKKIKDLPNLYLKNGDLVFNRTNSYELVGKCGIFYNEEPYTLASYLIRIRLGEHSIPDFYSNYINSSLCRETQIEPSIIQQNGQANFNGTKLSNIIAPLPPLSEQQRIVAKLDELMQYCDKLEVSIKESQQQNDLLLQQVLREALEPSYTQASDARPASDKSTAGRPKEKEVEKV